MRELLSRQKDVSLYVHLPFCSTKCGYCAFYSEPHDRWIDSYERYCDRLLEEMDISRELCGSFDTVFLGGGNPANVGHEYLKRLLVSSDPGHKAREISFEMNPETLDETFISYLEEGYATRMSMGIQSMDDEYLKRLGRNARREDNIRALSLIPKKRDFSFNADIITALPFQTEKMAKKDLDDMLSVCEPDHISLYCLTYEEGTRLYKDRDAGLGEDEQREILLFMWDYLESLGYHHYEISNFAREGHECRHNLRYWNLEPYLGLGSTAASRLSDGNSLVGFYNGSDLHQWCNGDIFSGYEREDLSISECAEEYIMVSLRTADGIDIPEFERRFDIPFNSLSLCEIDNGWYHMEKGRFALTTEGMMVCDTVILSLAKQL